MYSCFWVQIFNVLYQFKCMLFCFRKIKKVDYCVNREYIDSPLNVGHGYPTNDTLDHYPLRHLATVNYEKINKIFSNITHIDIEYPPIVASKAIYFQQGVIRFIFKRNIFILVG